MPFLRRVTAGRGVPDERLAEVAEHYYRFGGVSPINAQNRALAAALTDELAARGVDTTVRLANRNSEPFVGKVISALAPGPVLVALSSPFQSYSSCRQYREDLGAALAEARSDAREVEVAKLPPYAEDPGFRAVVTRLVIEAVDQALAEDPHAPVALICVAHSIPSAADAAAGRPGLGGHAYSRGLAELAAEITAAAAGHTGLELEADLAWCSRSGDPSTPWLEPDILDRLDAVAARGVKTVVVAPIGFVSDHLEVLYDLDIEAAQRCAQRGLRYVRAATVGIDPEYVSALVDLILERAAATRGEPTPRLGALPPADCPADCCLPTRSRRPTACAEEGA